ncbi:MAG: HAMP domain-containing histidine kinase [Candidatus Delongbacteria bacterium]|nr:HAMP domain-containing histidine kinase [Candidatus Delongbacteria bacterium]
MSVLFIFLSLYLSYHSLMLENHVRYVESVLVRYIEIADVSEFKKNSIINSQFNIQIVPNREVGENFVFREKDNLIVSYDFKSSVFFIKLVPFIIISILVLFGWIYLLVIKSMKNAENSKILISMSREAAHQMGTPISSLSGWIMYIKEVESIENDRDLIVSGLEEDHRRLETVAERFSKIGVPPEKEICNIIEVLNGVVNYLNMRVAISNEIKLELNIHEMSVFGNKVLLSWAFENVIKNAIQAISEKNNGQVKIVVTNKDEKGIIDIIDNGSGVIHKSRIFESGFSTRKRGWGMGLVLTKRVIEDIHDGKIYVSETSTNGSTFRIILPGYMN